MNRKQIALSIILVLAGILLGWYGLMTWQFATQLDRTNTIIYETTGRIDGVDNILVEYFGLDKGAANNQ